MIAVVALALQIAPASSGVLSVRGAAATADVPILSTPTGAAIALDQLAPAVPVTVQRAPNGDWLVSVAGVGVRCTAALPFLRVDRRIEPLAAPPSVRDGHLVLPLQVLTELLPRLAPDRVRFDRRRMELRVAADSTPIVAVAATAARPATPARRTGHAARRVVVVDAGHGGPDNGMSGPIGARRKIYEKNITLQVAKRVASALRERGLGVVMTRTTDTLIALSDRGRIANQHHGDVFVSIHVNAANPNWRDPGAARGFETYFLAEAKTEDAKRVEKMENASVRFETGVQAGKDDPLNFIMNDMAQNEHLRESSELADLIQQHLGSIEPGPSRGVKQAGFVVLVTAYMPAVLVEIGFGTNRADARFITSSTHQRAIAGAIADATVEYLAHYQKRLGAPTP